MRARVIQSQACVSKVSKTGYFFSPNAHLEGAHISHVCLLATVAGNLRNVIV